MDSCYLSKGAERMACYFLNENKIRGKALLSFMDSIDEDLGQKKRSPKMMKKSALTAYSGLKSQYIQEFALDLVPFFLSLDAEQIEKLDQSLQLEGTAALPSSSKKQKSSPSKEEDFCVENKKVIIEKLKNIGGFNVAKAIQLANTYNRLDKEYQQNAGYNTKVVNSKVRKVVVYFCCYIPWKLQEIEKESKKQEKSNQQSKSLDNERDFLANEEDNTIKSDICNSPKLIRSGTFVADSSSDSISTKDDDHNVKDKCAEDHETEETRDKLIHALKLAEQAQCVLKDRNQELNTCLRKERKASSKKLEICKTDINELNSQLEEKRLENIKITKSLADTESNLSKLMKDLKSTEDQLVSEKTHATELIESLKVEKEKTESLELQLSQKNKELEELKCTSLQNLNRIQVMEAEKRRKEWLPVEGTILTQEHKQLKKDLNEKVEEIGTLRAKLSKENVDFLLLQERYNNVEQKLAKEAEKLKNMQVQIVEKDKEISELNNKVDDLTEKRVKLLGRGGVNLGNRNRKFSVVNPQARKYASAFFVLSSACAVGASLTIPCLVLCITLAFAASIAFTLGCYCLYKGNTVLSNVEIDQRSNYNDSGHSSGTNTPDTFKGQPFFGSIIVNKLENAENHLIW